MPQGGSFHIDKALTNVSVEYRNNEYIADRIMGTIPVLKETDLYYVHGNEHFKAPTMKRANGAEAQQATWSLSTSSYTLHENAIKDVITRRDQENADSPLNLAVMTTEYVTDLVLKQRELDTRELLFTTTTWSNNEGVTATAWSLNTTTTLVVQKVLSVTTAIVKAAGKKPNKMVIGVTTLDNLKLHVDLVDRIKYVQRGIASEELLSSIFDMEVVVGRAVQDTTGHNLSGAKSFIWSGDALIGYFEMSPGLKKPSATYMFRKRNGMSVRRYRDEKVEGEWIECQDFSVAHAVATSCAYFLKGVDG